MRKLIYWLAESVDDAPCYSIVGRTKKSVIEQLATLTGRFGKPERRELEYEDALTFLNM